MQVAEVLIRLLGSDDPEIRGAAVFALGALVQVDSISSAEDFVADASSTSQQRLESIRLAEQERQAIERTIICAILELVCDASPLVRGEVAQTLGRVAIGHAVLFQDAVHVHQKTASRILPAQSPTNTRSKSLQDVSHNTPPGTNSSDSGWVAHTGGTSGVEQTVSSGKHYRPAFFRVIINTR